MSIAKETKTMIMTNEDNIITLFKRKSINTGMLYGIMPDIIKVRTYNDNDNNPHAVFLDFADGTSTSAVLQPNDAYDLEHAFSVCITKKLLDQATEGSGHQAYNKIVRRARKVYEDGLEEAERLEKEAAASKVRAEKLAEKKRKREKRRVEEHLAAQEKAREEYIEIEKEAFLRALREHQITVDDLK